MTTSAPGQRRRTVARAARDAFGATGKPDVPRMWDAAEHAYVDVLACPDTPDQGLTTYSTLSLHETTNLLDGRDIRVEVATALGSVATAEDVAAIEALKAVSEGKQRNKALKKAAGDSLRKITGMGPAKKKKK